MTYADELDDRDAARADMTALLDEDPHDWPDAQWCPAHGWHIPITHGCPHCFGLRVAHTLAMRNADPDAYDAHHDHQHAHPEGPT